MPREFKLICSICGKEFTGAAHNVKYCSPKCKEIGDAARRRLWEQKSDYSQRRKEKRRKGSAQRTPVRSERKDPAPTHGKILIRDLYSFEFWEQWKEDQIREAASFGRKVGGFVNGIPVNDPDFSLKVVLTIQELKSIRYEYYRGEPICEN